MRKDNIDSGSFVEEYSALLLRMADAYVADFVQNPKGPASVFLNGYESAIYHVSEFIKANPANMLPVFLTEILESFKYLCDKGNLDHTAISIEI